MKIGIFDSGSGGLTTLAAIRKLLPEAEYYYIGDRHSKIAAFFPNAEILDGNSGVARRVKALATSFPD